MSGGWKDYYQCRMIEDRTWLIRDLYGDCSYLLEGEKYALLIDTGIGLPGFEEAVRQLTDKPVRVLLTHGHLDHIGGCGYWKEVMIHEKEISTLGRHQNAGYRQIIRGLTKEVGLKLKEEAIRNCIHIKIPREINFIKEKDHGQAIDLGGRRLIIMETPGHTEGSVCLWEPDRKALYSGDTICENRVMLSFPESCSPACYGRSLKKLASIQDKIQKIYAGHNKVPLPPAWIGHFMDCAAALAGNRQMGSIEETPRLPYPVFFQNWKEDRFCINCVTGPDEYTCMVNNNYYTNACARYNLEWIGRFTDKFQKEDGWKSFADQMGLTIRELEEMDGAAKGMFLPYDEKLGINPQDDSFLSKPVWDIKGTPKDKFPLLLHYHPLHLYRYQVCKQADTILSYFLFPDYQDEETMKKSFSYYEEITTHDSSLSTCVFSIMASRLGMKEKAYRYLAIVFGFAMLQIKENTIALSPWLPDAWHAYRFRFRYQGRLVEVQVNRDESRIHLLKGEPVETEFYGAKKRLEEKQGLKWNGREVCFL